MKLLALIALIFGFTRSAEAAFRCETHWGTPATVHLSFEKFIARFRSYYPNGPHLKRTGQSGGNHYYRDGLGTSLYLAIVPDSTLRAGRGKIYYFIPSRFHSDGNHQERVTLYCNR